MEPWTSIACRTVTRICLRCHAPTLTHTMLLWLVLVPLALAAQWMRRLAGCAWRWWREVRARSRCPSPSVLPHCCAFAGDFASGTSSKSTKLIHGGVRYLEKAFFNLDYGQYKLVREALHERNVWMDIAPHLSSWLPIMLPVFKWYVQYLAAVLGIDFVVTKHGAWPWFTIFGWCSWQVASPVLLGWRDCL